MGGLRRRRAEEEEEEAVGALVAPRFAGISIGEIKTCASGKTLANKQQA